MEHQRIDFEAPEPEEPTERLSDLALGEIGEIVSISRSCRLAR